MNTCATRRSDRVLVVFAILGVVAAGAFAQVRLETSGESAKGNRNYKIEQAVPSNMGQAKLICATPYGEKGPDSVDFVRVLRDRSILVAGNRAAKEGSGWSPFFMRSSYSGDEREQGVGYLMRMTVTDDARVSTKTRVELPGKLNKLKLDKSGRIAVLLDKVCVYLIEPGAAEPVKDCAHEGIRDFDTDSTGELLILTKTELIRYDATWQKVLWKATIPCRGTNQGAYVAVDGTSGVAVVLGSATAHTGRDTWRGVYCHGFDREGKKVWTLWNYDPRGQLSKRDGGNDLTADTWGRSVTVGRDGKAYVTLMTSHEKTVLTRDPEDVSKPIDPGLFAGAFESAPGKKYSTYGRPGASVIFRLNPSTGAIEHGTWMNAWLTLDAKANPLYMVSSACDDQGRVAVVGYSDYGCPVKDPWYFDENKFRGHGFLAIFDKGFQILQSGFFHQTSITAVDIAHGYVVIGGQTLEGSEDQGMNLKVHNPIQSVLSDNYPEGFLAVFAIGEHGEPQALGPLVGVRGAVAAAPKPVRVHTPATPAQKAAVELEKAKDLVQAKKYAEAQAKIEYILARYIDTPAAAGARALARKMQKDIAAAAAVKDGLSNGASPEDERAANRLLQQAQNYLANGMKNLAKPKLQEIMKKYPKTEAAKKADQLLIKEFQI